MSTTQKTTNNTSSAKSLRFLLLWLLLAWAICSIGFRLVLSDLGVYTDRLEQLVAEKTKLDVKIGSLSGRWMLITPVIEVKNLQVFQSVDVDISRETESLAKKPVIEIKHIAVELDLLGSLLGLSPRFRRVLIDGVDFELEVNPETGKVSLVGLKLKAGENSVKNIEKILDRYVLTSEQLLLLDSTILFSFPEQEKLTFNMQHLILDNVWMNHALNIKLELVEESGFSRSVAIDGVFEGNPLDFETFSSHAYINIEAGELSDWLEKDFWPKSYVKFHSGKLDMEAWFGIKKGVLETLSFTTSFEDISFNALPGVDELKKKNNTETEMSNETSVKKMPRQVINKLAFTAEILASVDLLQLNKPGYIKNLVKQSIDIKVSELTLHWNEIFLDDFRLVFSQIKGNPSEHPLASNWREAFKGSENRNEVLIHRLAVSHLPLDMVHNISTLIPELRERKNLLEQLSPVGSIRQIQVIAADILEKDFSFDSNIYMSAVASDIGIAALEKIPAIEGLDFYLEYAPRVLGVELNSKNVVLREHAELFRDDLNNASLKSNFLLEVLPGDIVVHSDLAKISNDWVSAEAMFSASAPYRFYPDGERELPAWSLQINLSPIPVERAKMFFLAKLPAPFLSWVDDFLQDGFIGGDLLIFAFTKKRLPDTFATFLANLDIEKARLDYLPGKWPELNDVKANIKVTNDQLTAEVSEAKMFSTQLYNGKVFIESYLDENLPRVKLTGEASGALNDLQKLFLESELKDSIGIVVEDWVVHGDHKSILDLDIPLLADAQQSPSEIEVSVSVNDALLAIPDVGLGVKSLQSKLHYSLTNGLSTDSLSALFFDKVIEGKIQTKETLGNQVIQISGAGSIDASDLQSWQDFWLFKNLQGSTDFDADIWIGELDSINYLSPVIGEKSLLVDDVSAESLSSELNKSYKAKQHVVRVDILTSLEDMAINLPGEYRKKQGGQAPSHIQLDVLEDTLVYRVDYNQRLGVVAETRGQDFERGRIHFSEGLYSLPVNKGLVVTGSIGSMNFDEWIDYISKHLLDELPSNQSTAADGSIEDPASIISRMDLSIARFTGFGQHMNNVKVFITRENLNWRVDVENELVKGIVLVPDEHLISKQNPIIAKLDYLQLDETQIDTQVEKNQDDNGGKEFEKSNNISMEVDNEVYLPEDFPFLNVDVTSVRVGKTKHGRWRIDLHPDEKGMDFQVHQLNYGLMTINGKGRWNYSQESSVTHFKGHIRTSAVTRLFGALNLRPSSDSAGLMAIELKWPGSPMDFDYDKMQGTAGLKVLDGSIVEIDIKSKKFRALGIFNLGVLTDIITLRLFKKIGKGINDALNAEKEQEGSR